MSAYLGIDIGSLNIKISGVVTNDSYDHFNKIINNNTSYRWTKYTFDSSKIFVLESVKVSGNPKQKVLEIIENINKDFGVENISGITITGIASKLISNILDIKNITEFKAIAESFTSLFPNIKNIFEIGAENSKYISLKDGLILDYETNGDCAAGTGSFLDQQAKRLMFEVQDISNITKNIEKAPVIAGRCSVFAKSDMIHAQQKGYKPEEILKGLCNTIAINFKSNLLKGKDLNKPVAFIGGVSINKTVAEDIKTLFNLSDEEFIVPDFSNYFLSFGAALIEFKRYEHSIGSKEFVEIEEKFPTLKKLDMNNVLLLRDKVQAYNFENNLINTFLGVDIGSVSTNLVLIDSNGVLVKEIYLMTSGRPIEAVNAGLKEIYEELKDKINIIGVATTGSGRELIGELLGADFVKDEITAHKTGSSFISQKYFNKDIDTIFEIGGQDSKFISINKGVVTDFHMNEACSAGTGSFLQEQAEKLGVNIKGEFTNLALNSNNPINLGDRCTVFIEKDLNIYQQKGAKLEDIIAGLAYSVVNNYLHRVVKERKIGEVIYFQGGTAYNDAVASAFSMVLNKKIIVPPHNGVMGAVGMALIAKNEYDKTQYFTKFRGFDLNKINYSIKEFTCKSCSNNCDIQEFTVEGSKTYWGDKCSEKFRKAVKTNLKPLIKDLFIEREKLLLKSYNDYNQNSDNTKKTIGFPRSMYFYDRLPFWSTFFGELGFNMILSDPTNKKIASDGTEIVVADPCFPVKVAHGHLANLIEKKPDYILLPYMLTGECFHSKQSNSKIVKGREQTYFCPWVQTLPDVLKSNKKFYSYNDKFIMPKMELRETAEFVISDLYKEINKKFSYISYDSVKKAYYLAIMALEKFKIELSTLYDEAIDIINANDRELIVIIGRPYNVNDKGINLNLTSKLRDLYGVNVIPIDFIPVQDQDIDDVNNNMFWSYGKKILKTLKKVKTNSKIHVIYVTNFQCGPDSYIKHFAPLALNKSYLTLQFDGHGNDAGMITRCEAYLDSKGVF